MIKSALICALLALLPLFPSSINAQNEAHSAKTSSSEVSNSPYDLVETIVLEFLKKTKLPGLSIAVSKYEKVIYAKGFGYADVEKKVAMTPATQLRTASVSKVITATALGRLVSEGKLDLDAPIKKYISYIDPQYADLTTRQLAGHTSGLVHRPKGSSYKKKAFTEIKETVELIKSPLLFSPDSKYKYSTNGFNLLAAVIEGASGMSFAQYMQAEVCKPLGMTQTAPENIHALTEKDASLYYFKKDKLRKEKLTDASYKVAGAGFRSTPIDLVNMMNAYTNGFISQEVVAEMFKSHELSNGEKTNVGIAWRSSYDTFGNSLVDHAGSWRGARTVVVHYPKEQLSISLMINADCQIFIEETAHILAQLFREYPNPAPSMGDLNQDLSVSIRNNGKENTYQGNLSFSGDTGTLSVNNEGFLANNPVYYLGQKEQYAVVTTYGLMYLHVSQGPSFEGELYLYANRNKSNPMEEKSLASFTALNK